MTHGQGNDAQTWAMTHGHRQCRADTGHDVWTQETTSGHGQR